MENVREVAVPTPFGDASDVFFVGEVDGERIAFLPRHGRYHTLSPYTVPYVANAFAAKMLGVERAVLVSACGGMKKDWKKGDFVLFDQLLDFTGDSPKSMFLKFIIAHVALEGFRCAAQSFKVHRILDDAGLTVHDGGKLITVEQFFAGGWASSIFADRFGAEGIGMTTGREVPPLLEAEIHVTVIGHLTDGNGSEEEGGVSAALVKEQGPVNMARLIDPLRDIVVELALLEATCECATRLDGAMQTDRACFVHRRQQELAPILARYLRDHSKQG